MDVEYFLHRRACSSQQPWILVEPSVNVVALASRTRDAHAVHRTEPTLNSFEVRRVYVRKARLPRSRDQGSAREPES